MTRPTDMKKIFILIAMLSLAVAYLYGFSQRGKDALITLHDSFPPGTVFVEQSRNPLVFEVIKPGEGGLPNFVVIAEGHGYGGPLQVASIITPAGVLEKTIVVDNKETPSWFRKVQENNFFNQFTDLLVSAPMLESKGESKGIDMVTGATVSSKAFTTAIRAGSHAVGRQYLNQSIEEQEAEWAFGRNEMILLLLYGIILLGSWKELPKLRYLTLLSGLVFIGFYLSNPITLSNFSALLLGYFKPLKEELFWWLLVGGSLLMALVLGKNLYCSWLCPFGAIQELVAKLGGIGVRLDKKVVRYVKYSSYFLTWLALMVIFTTSNGPLGSYEPFGTIFGYQGVGAQWFILPVVILGSFVLPRFWCRFFCPVGVLLDLTGKIRRTVNRMTGRSKKPVSPVVSLPKHGEADCPRKVA